MAFKIIIDGYNLIRQSNIFGNFEKENLQKGRRELIKSLAQYKRLKGHAICVVFDGWQGGGVHEGKETIGGVNVIYSKLGEKADEVIKRIAQREGDGAVVITSDSELSKFVEKRGGVSIPSYEFEKKMNIASQSFMKDDIYDEYEEGRITTKKKGPAKRLSKQERKMQQKLKKL